MILTVPVELDMESHQELYHDRCRSYCHIERCRRPKFLRRLVLGHCRRTSRSHSSCHSSMFLRTGSRLLELHQAKKGYFKHEVRLIDVVKRNAVSLNLTFTADSLHVTDLKYRIPHCCHCNIDPAPAPYFRDFCHWGSWLEVGSDVVSDVCVKFGDCKSSHFCVMQPWMIMIRMQTIPLSKTLYWRFT